MRAKVHAKYPDIGKKQFGGVARMPRAPRAAGLIGAPRPMRPAPITPRISGRLSSSAGMQKGGVASFPKPHTYASGGVTDRVGREALTGKREMLPKFHGGGVAKSQSGDRSPAACGSMKEAGGFAGLGIKRG